MGRDRVIRLLEWSAIVAVSLAIAVGVIAVLSGGLLAGRDQPGVSGAANVVGEQFRDLGHAHLRPGESAPAYDSDPPTSGAHVPAPIQRDEAQISDDQLLQALELGDVVIMYGSRAPPAGLKALAGDVGAPFSPALAAAGQAVIIARRPGTTGLIGLAWTHLLRVSTSDDPPLRTFAQAWLGRGAPGR
jgi:Protein of unknown function (DUF3105)